MTSLQTQVGNLVRHHREQARLTQAQLAERCGRSVELISRIERGAGAPSFDTLEVLSRELQIDVRDLFGVGSFAAGSSTDALAKLVGRLAGLDPEDLEWADRVLAAALSRKVRSRLEPAPKS